MDKPVAAIEFGSKKMKLVVGYELDGQVYVIYAITKPYGHIIENGKILDLEKIVQNVREIRNFTDSSVRLKLSISEALLSLPPFGLDVLQTRQVTTSVSEDFKIVDLDIKNIYSLVRNSSSALKDALIDVIPEAYILDQGRVFLRPPLGESSSTLTVSVKIHTLPASVAESYRAALIGGDIAVKKMMLAPFAACKLLATMPNVPEDYILVDIGSNVTTVSLVGGKQLFASRSFEWGGDKITEKIIENFNINEAEAEKLKITYGVTNREMNFKAPVCSNKDEEGNVFKHYADELNVLVKSQLDIFTKNLNSAITALLDGYEASYRSLPMVLIGGGAALDGLVEYLTPKVQSDTVMHVVPKTFGCRDGTYFNCIGMILECNNYPNVYDDNHPKVGQLSRESDK